MTRLMGDYCHASLPRQRSIVTLLTHFGARFFVFQKTIIRHRSPALMKINIIETDMRQFGVDHHRTDIEMNSPSEPQATVPWNSYSEFLDRVSAWIPTLKAAKIRPPATGKTWYGYDILANFWAIGDLIHELPDNWLPLLKSGRIADIGGADGDLGFSLAAMGLEVDLIDWPATNWNGLDGARALKNRLGAQQVTIHEIDLDSQFKLPQRNYDLVFFLGILYHLKNPFYILEKLALSCSYCFLSTRIARFSPNQGVCLEHAPVAYLLDPDECNNDATNYWIFSESGLVRLAQRTGWNIVASRRVGDTKNSNPSDDEHDERIFLALKSRHR